MVVALAGSCALVLPAHRFLGVDDLWLLLLFLILWVLLEVFVETAKERRTLPKSVRRKEAALRNHIRRRD
jgi:hypothetical protein